MYNIYYINIHNYVSFMVAEMTVDITVKSATIMHFLTLMHLNSFPILCPYPPSIFLGTWASLSH